MQEQKFLSSFEANFRKAIKEHNLLSKKDRVIVACSGGKDSTTVLYLLNKLGYNVEAMIIDLSNAKYFQDNLRNLRHLCKKEGIGLHVVDFRKEFGYSVCYIRSVLEAKKLKLRSCSICGILKRYLLNKKARELGATKLALGHNLDDEAQTAIMNLINGNIEIGMKAGPKTDGPIDKKFVPRIKPLFFCPENEIREYSEYMGFPVIYERCPCSAGACRPQIRNILNGLEEKYPEIKLNILKNSLHFKKIIREQNRGNGNRKIKYCKSCGEPSKNETCSACQLMRKMFGNN